MELRCFNLRNNFRIRVLQRFADELPFRTILIMRKRGMGLHAFGKHRIIIVLQRIPTKL